MFSKSRLRQRRQKASESVYMRERVNVELQPFSSKPFPTTFEIIVAKGEIAHNEKFLFWLQ